MDERCFELASKHVGEGYIRQAKEAMTGLNSKMKLLLEQAGGYLAYYKSGNIKSCVFTVKFTTSQEKNVM